MDTEKPITEFNSPNDVEIVEDNYNNSKKKLKIKIIIIILIAIAATFIVPFVVSQMLIWIFVGLVEDSQKDAPKVEDYQTYLEEKYGTDKEFYYTGKENCNWFETGRCSYEFSSNELNGTSFTVTSERESRDDGKKEYIFKDDYKSRKKLAALEVQYYGFLDSTIPYDYQLEMQQYSFSTNPTLYIYVKYNDIPNIGEINPTALRADILGAIPEQYQNINIEFEVILYAGSGVSYGYLEKCPEFFDSGSYSSDDGANSCSLTIK